MQTLNTWLKQFDTLPLECDGMTRVVSTLLQRDGVEHEICIGRLEVDGVGATPMHWWISFPDGQVCDLRARMWLDDESRVPHGAFTPEPHQRYVETARMRAATHRLDPLIFMILAERTMDQFPSAASEVEIAESANTRTKPPAFGI